MKLNCLLDIFFLLSLTVQCQGFEEMVQWDNELHGHIDCDWKKDKATDMQYCFKHGVTYFNTMAPQPSSSPSDVPSSQPSPTLEPSVTPSWHSSHKTPKPPSWFKARPWFVPWPPLRCPANKIDENLILECMIYDENHLYYSNGAHIYSHTHDHYACLHKLIVDPMSCYKIWCPDPYYPNKQHCAEFHRQSFEDDDYYSRFTFEDDDWNPSKPIWPWNTIRPSGTADDF